MYQKLSVTRPAAGDPISGKVASVVAAGLFVRPKTTDPTELVASDVDYPHIFMLEQPVVSQVDYDAAVFKREAITQALGGGSPQHQIQDLRHPVPVNSWVSARRVDEIEVESDNGDVLNTGSIDDTTAVGTKVEIVSGKLNVSSGEGQGIISSKVASTITSGEQRFTVAFGVTGA